MNFYNPYFYSLPQTTTPSLGLLGRVANSTRGLSLGTIVNGTQKTLNIINQAIPIIKEASPMMQNAKTMFKIANEFKKVDTPVNESVKQENLETKQTEISNENGPIFFL